MTERQSTRSILLVSLWTMVKNVDWKLIVNSRLISSSLILSSTWHFGSDLSQSCSLQLRGFSHSKITNRQKALGVKSFFRKCFEISIVEALMAWLQEPSIRYYFYSNQIISSQNMLL